MKRNQTRIRTFCSVCGKPSKYEGYVHVPCQRVLKNREYRLNNPLEKKRKRSYIKKEKRIIQKKTQPIKKEKQIIQKEKHIHKNMKETILSILGREYNNEYDIIELKEKLHHLIHIDLMTPKQIKDKYKLPYSQMFSFLSRTLGIKMRSIEEAQELIRTQNNNLKTEKRIYYEKCKFLFDIYKLPDLKGFDLLSKYRLMPRNPKNRIDEHYVHRDHMISRDYGWLNNIPPEHIAHPANCEILLDTKNIKKGNGCSITYDELLVRIKEWNDENTIINISRTKHSIQRKEQLRQKNLGKKTYNDGIKNYIVFAGDTPEPHWVLGMVKNNNKCEAVLT